MKRVFFLVAVAMMMLFAFNSCKTDTGQLVGAKNRPEFVDEQPYGMKFIPHGHFLMGAGDQDAAYSYTYSAKNITVSSFYMDETEITNNEYRQFVEWVRDSIAHVLLGEAEVEEENEHFVKYGKGHEEEGEFMEPRFINWRTKIDWDSDNEEYRAALSPIYSSPVSGNERYYYYKMVDLNAKVMNFEYWWTDRSNYRDEEDPDVMGAAFKDFDNIDPQTEDQGMYSNRPVAYSQGRKPFLRRESVNIYPDTLCWMHDYAYSFNEPMTESYFWHPAYDNYPVVGVNWKQAQAFCAWRTHIRNAYLISEKNWAYENRFRLPNESEWEYASRGDRDLDPFPWGGPYTMNQNGCFLANFKPRRGDYCADGGTYPIIVAHYHPNDWGLYDMSGNVAEWCEDAYSESAYNFAHDLNMQFTYNAKKSDPEALKRKVIRGGSWKDISYYIHNEARTYEYQDTGKCYIGFRCVQSYLGRVKGDSEKTSTNVY